MTAVATTALSETPFGGDSSWRMMIRIALPLSASAALRYAVELSNLYWVGKLGLMALSIMTSLGTFLWLSKMFAGFTTAGTSAVIGRMLGEGRPDDAARTSQKVTAVTPVLGLAVALVALAASPRALDILSYDGGARRQAALYLYVLLAGLPVTFGAMSTNGALVGLGQPRASLLASSASLAVAFVATPTLVHGAGLGIAGAAAAQVAGDAVGYFVGLRAIEAHVRPHGILPWRKRFRKLRELLPVVRIGAPLTLDAVVHTTVTFALIAYLSRFGPEYVAAQGAEERFTQILNLPTEGLAPAAATLVGFELGRGRSKEALRIVWQALTAVGAISVGGVVLLRLMPAPVVAALCDDPAFVHVGLRLLAVASLGLAFIGGRDVLEAAFGGVGNTVPPVVIGLVTTLLRFPLAYVLAVHLETGGYGVSWAMSITLALQTTVLLIWFRARFPKTPGRPIEPIAKSIPPPA